MSGEVDGAGGGGVRLPRELVLASAGAGKTFRISSRIVGLLDLGAPPEDIFASTFTRKAAGEILERVLERMARAALDPEAARALAGHARIGTSHGRPPGDPGRWQDLLGVLTGDLHRINVGTLDAFFVRSAGSFQLELGLPPGWRIGDASTLERLHSRALEEVLRGAGTDEVVELIRASLGGEAGRSVHRRILEKVRDLRWLVHQIDPEAGDPWSPFDAEATPTDQEERSRAARAVEALEPPANKDGSPNAVWSRELERAVGVVRSGDWDALLAKGLAPKVLDGEDAYARKPLEPPVVAAFEEALRLARRDLRHDYARQARALGRLARRFQEALAGLQRREGVYGFLDITGLVGGEEPLGARDDLWYRLDQRIRHVLLDEFQDTSLPQWEALQPLVEELLAGHGEERAAVVVADPKQSIYGWRGAEPALVHRVRRRFPLEPDRLARSYRSSEIVLEFVNRIFGGLGDSPFWDDAEDDRRLARSWLEDFGPHEAAYELPGRVRVEVGPREDDMRSDDRPRMMRRAARRVREIRRRAPGFTVGVLLRKNRNVPRLMAELRRLGLEASEEGGTHLTDSPAVSALLALLRLADHPGHTVARYHVAASPLGPLFGIDGPDDDAGARRVSREVRRSLVEEGYGPTLDGYVRGIGSRGLAGSRDLRRLFQLVELGFRRDAGEGGLRPGGFVEFAETERMEDPAAAGIRVMTVHQSKGLEFDVVVLPELDLGMTGGGPSVPAALPERDPETGRIVRVFPYVTKSAVKLLPEAVPAAVQARASALRDALGVLYVGMTRARFALHLMLAADGAGGPSSSATFARLVRCALDAHRDAVADGDVLHEAGDPAWPERVPSEHRRPPRDATGGAPERLRVELRDARVRSRSLPHRTPSELKGGGRVALSELVELDGGGRAGARRTGTVVHAWCAAIGWLGEGGEGIPDDEELLASARRLDPELDEAELRELLAEFRDWLREPEVRSVFRRPEEPSAGRGDPVLERERPFALRVDDGLLRGAIDRLVVSGDRARVVDFKTDRVEPGSAALAERAELYRPQLRAYRRAAARLHRLDEDHVRADLVFLRAGVVRRVD